MLPLYKLDFLSLEQVFRSFHIKDIVSLALLSTRSFKTVRAFLKHIRPRRVFIDLEISKKHKITVYLGSEMLNIKMSNNSYLREEQNFRGVPVLEASQSKFQGIEYSVFDDCHNGLTTYWEDENIAIRMLYQYISNLFDKPVSGLIYFPVSRNLHLGLLELIMQNQDSISHANVCFTEPFCLNNGRAMKILSIVEKIILDVPFPNFSLPKHKYQNLTIENGNWVTLSELKRIDCKFLYICQNLADVNPLKDDELVEFLNLWTNGFFPNLTDFRLETNASISLEKILKDFVTEPSDMDVSEIEDEWNVVTGGPLNVRQLKTGKSATVYTMNTENFDGSEVSFFSMSVID
ncbi:unnamed protein product [Caenorhabditis brenneri]